MDASSVLSDDDYDVISNPGLDSSIADLNMVSRPPSEPQPLADAQAKWATASLEAQDVQKWTLGTMLTQDGNAERTRRVYVDGVFDVFTVG